MDGLRGRSAHGRVDALAADTIASVRSKTLHNMVDRTHEIIDEMCSKINLIENYFTSLSGSYGAKVAGVGTEPQTLYSSTDLAGIRLQDIDCRLSAIYEGLQDAFGNGKIT